MWNILLFMNKTLSKSLMQRTAFLKNIEGSIRSKKEILCPDSQNRKVHYSTLDISYIKQKVTRNCQTLFMRLVRIDQHVRYK